jgi:hypothetical protein
MPDVTLSDGREITFDLSSLTLGEYRALFSAKQKPEDEDRIISRTSGIPVEEFGSLKYLDWKRLTLAFFKKTRSPLADPNLDSESTST